MQVILESMVIASLHSEVLRITRDFRISQLATSDGFCNIVRASDYPDKAARPINLIEAESKNANPLSADLAELVVDVETPDGETLAIDDPALIEMLRANIDQKHQVTLMQSQRAMTDCRPVSIFSLQSAQQLG